MTAIRQIMVLLFLQNTNYSRLSDRMLRACLKHLVAAARNNQGGPKRETALITEFKKIYYSNLI